MKSCFRGGKSVLLRGQNYFNGKTGWWVSPEKCSNSKATDRYVSIVLTEHGLKIYIIILVAISSYKLS
jgi:hypothetical protein